MEVIKILKKNPQKPGKKLPGGDSNPRHSNVKPPRVLRLGGAGSILLWGEDFFSVLEGFFKFLITSIEFYDFLMRFHLFSSNFSMIFEFIL